MFVPSGNGAGAHVYILDTGIRTTHEEFENRATFVYDAMESEPVRLGIRSQFFCGQPRKQALTQSHNSKSKNVAYKVVTGGRLWGQSCDRINLPSINLLPVLGCGLILYRKLPFLIKNELLIMIIAPTLEVWSIREDLYKGYYLALHMCHLNNFKLSQLICNNSEDLEIACKGHARLVVSGKGRL